MSSRVPHKVSTTKDGVFQHTWTVGVSGSATGLKTTYLHGTEDHVVVSGTSPGHVYLGLDRQYSYYELLGWDARLSAGSSSSFSFGGTDQHTKERYVVLPLAYVYPNGNSFTSVSGVYTNPGTSTNQNAIDWNGRGYFHVEISKLVQGSGTYTGVAPISATLADPIDQSVAYGSPTAKITFTAVFRNRSR